MSYVASGIELDSREVGSYILSFIPEFVVKIQNSTVSNSWFKKFTITSHFDVVVGDGDKMLLCPVRFVMKYLIRTELYRPACTTKRKKQFP